MDPLELERMLADRQRTQREKLGLLSGSARPALEALDDEALLKSLRSIRKAINSKKLRAARDELLGSLRRDGLDGTAPLPKPTPPEPSPAEASSSSAERDSQRNPQLEAELARDPRAREIYQVYRDWLETRGLVFDGRVSLGVLADADDMLTQVDWYCGFICACHLSYSLARFNGVRPPLSIEQALACLLDDPGPGRFVRTLTIGLALHDDNDYRGVCEVIGRRPRPALEELFIGDFGYEQCELNWSTISDTSAMWPALPRLRKLSLRAGSMQLDGIDLPALRELETITGGMPASALHAIASARWPALERMCLQIGTARENAATDVSLLEPLLEGSGLPRLEHLGLTNCEFTDELCRRLPGSPILGRLRSLDLSMGTMSMAGAEALARRPSLLAHLEWIDVDDNYLPDEARVLLDGLGPRIEFGAQRTDEGRGRYASAFE